MAATFPVSTRVLRRQSIVRSTRAIPSSESGVAGADYCRSTIPMSTVGTGIKRVDVDEFYDIKEYRPKVRHVLGKPMFCIGG